MESKSAAMGRLIARRRKELGMTQRQLAARLHVTDKAVSKWERGLSCPDIVLLPELAGLLDLTEGELLKGRQDPAEAGQDPEFSPSEGPLFFPTDQPPADGGPPYPKKQPKRPIPRRTVSAAALTLTVIIGAAVCLIVDQAVNGRLTWSYIPLMSMGLCWGTAMPALLIRRGGGWAGLTVFTGMIFRFLAALDRLLPGDILRIGRPMAELGVVYLWACAIAWTRCKRWKRRAAWGALFTAVIHLAVNGRLALLLKEPPDLAWTLLSSLTLLGTALILFRWDRETE